MKKLRYLVVSILLICLSAVLLLGACGKSGSPAGGGLVFNTKYVRGAFGEDVENYFLFRSDGTGDYACNNDYTYAAAEHYTMHFKWFYADQEESAVVCFYDGAEYDEQKHKAPRIGDDTHYLVTVSEHVLCVSSGTSSSCYINENYVDELENYRKD